MKKEEEEEKERFLHLEREGKTFTPQFFKKIEGIDFSPLTPAQIREAIPGSDWNRFQYKDEVSSLPIRYDYAQTGTSRCLSPSGKKRLSSDYADCIWIPLVEIPGRGIECVRVIPRTESIEWLSHEHQYSPEFFMEGGGGGGK